MPAPTALRQPVTDTEVSTPPADQDEQVLDPSASTAILTELTAIPPAAITQGQDAEMTIDEEGLPRFAPSKDADPIRRVEMRKVPVPPHRWAPFKANWAKIYTPLCEQMVRTRKLQVRMNIKRRTVELRTSKFTESNASLQKGVDFVEAIVRGFDIEDAVALLRLDDLYIETFEIKDVKTLNGDHLARAIGRLAGKDGKTKYAIENASRTRIVLADSKIHILGSFKNIHFARESLVDLILGKPPSKVYGNLRTVAARMKERF